MVHQIENGPSINITFNNGTARVAIGSQGDIQSFLVKWFSDGDFVGEMELGKLSWGSYNNYGISNWAIEFWHDGKLISTFDNKLENKPVLIIAKFNKKTPGKMHSISELTKYVEEVVSKYACTVFVYFKGSERYEFPDGYYEPLGINRDISEFSTIIEKTFNG